MAAVLLSNGANANQADMWTRKSIEMTTNQKIKDMLFFHAAENGDLALMQQGINDKIDVNCRDGDGRTAVYWAAWKGHLHLVEYLITQHADLSIADVSVNINQTTLSLQ